MAPKESGSTARSELAALATGQPFQWLKLGTFGGPMTHSASCCFQWHLCCKDLPTESGSSHQSSSFLLHVFSLFHLISPF